MRSSISRVILAGVIGSVLMPLHAAFAIEFGRPDFSNYMSRPGLVTCDWQYDSYTRACPTPEEPPKVQAPAKAAGKAKAKPKKAG